MNPPQRDDPIGGPLATAVVTWLLLTLAGYCVWRGQARELAGAIIGYVGSYWLPARPALRSNGGETGG